jgi:purine-nucleoside/S-methyl-5'-thioadenosine phosphorylase / adenosine deaminase
VSAPEPIELELPGARVAFSTRNGGVSDGPYRSLNLGILTDDEPARVTDNRRRLAGSVGLAQEAVAMVWQVHGAELADWKEPPRCGGYAVPGAPLRQVDGHLTDLPGVGLLILGADCLPVALAGPGRVAMLHCGWRGLAAGIVERAVARFAEPPAAAIGPGIGRCCYEVGSEVLAAFEELDGVASGRMLDLPAVARARLEASGVSRIEDVDLCTSCRADLFFSHRRDSGITGRQGGLVWRET